MMYYLFSFAALGAAFSLVACVYSVILREPEMLLNGWHNRLDKKLGPGSQKRTTTTVQTVLGPKPAEFLGKPRAMWLYKLLGGCPRCSAGQVAAWGYLLLCWWTGTQYALFAHVLSTAVSIYLVTFFQKAYNWSRKS